MKFISPAAGTQIAIPASAVWPSIAFQTDATGPHVWNWDVSWKTFKVSGVEQTDSNLWDAQSVAKNYGGTLTVTAKAGNDAATMAVTITGTNPSSAELAQFLATIANSSGFDKILQHETRCCHFDKTGNPVKSFDNGYGMSQLTTPAPTFPQIWNWQNNVQAGLALFAAKRAAAVAYLKQNNRTYTEDQLKRETVCRWNGGHYHEWDDKAGQWVRPASMLCDSKAGSIGWDMRDAANVGKTEAELHNRDAASYSKPPTNGAHWKYSGVCYADQVLG
jgi:hypothetical protein